MGKLIIKNNGYTTEIVNGIPFSAITAETNTNYLGFNPFTNILESLNPSGQTTIYDKMVKNMKFYRQPNGGIYKNKVWNKREYK